MRYRTLPRTGLALTELGFGAASLGNLYVAMDDETARATVDAAWTGGIRYFDTAPHYGLGLSERRLGAALAGRDRAGYVVSTKVGRLLVDNPRPTGSDLAVGGFAVPDALTRVPDYSRDGVRRSLDSSLTRLGLDRIDIVYVHDPDDHVTQAIAEAVPALVQLREQGVIGAVGVGMNHVDPLLRFVGASDLDVVMVAGRWTLADRRAEPLLDACAARSIGVVAAAPFNSGLLADPGAGVVRFDYERAPPHLVEFAGRAAGLAERHGVRLPQAALQFPLRSPHVTAVVAGMASPVEVAADVAWASDPVPERAWRALLDLDPPPC